MHLGEDLKGRKNDGYAVCDPTLGLIMINRSLPPTIPLLILSRISLSNTPSISGGNNSRNGANASPFFKAGYLRAGHNARISVQFKAIAPHPYICLMHQQIGKHRNIKWDRIQSISSLLRTMGIEDFLWALTTPSTFPNALPSTWRNQKARH